MPAILDIDAGSAVIVGANDADDGLGCAHRIEELADLALEAVALSPADASSSLAAARNEERDHKAKQNSETGNDLLQHHRAADAIIGLRGGLGKRICDRGLDPVDLAGRSCSIKKPRARW